MELGRAPYSFVKRIARSASRQDFADMLEDRRYLEWRSLAILLLAQSDDPYFRSSDRSAEERREVLSALSMLGAEADRELQNRIVKSYGVLIERVPAFAASVAEDLATQNVSKRDVGKLLGEPFATAVVNLEPESWQGPIRARAATGTRPGARCRSQGMGA